MASFLTLEVNLLMVPVLALFVLYCVPIPVVSKVAERITRLIEKYSFNGLTVMSATAIISSLTFLFDFFEWQSKYDSKSKFTDISLQLQHDNKRLRLERNMYIHLVTCVLCLAVKKLGALLHQQEAHPTAVPAPQHAEAAPHAKSS